MADLSLKEYENLILSSLEEAQQMDTKAQTEALMKKTGEDRKSWLSQFYDSLFGKTSEATIEPFQTEPLAPIIPDQAVMMEMAQIAAPLQNSPTLDMYQGMDVDNTEDVTQAQADRLRASLDAQIAMPTDSGATETTMVDVTDSDMGKLSNEEPLYKMAEEIDPGTIETKELGLMSKPKAATDDDMGLPSSPSQVEELKGLYAKKGPAYKESQIVSHSYIKDPIVKGGVRGKSRVHGDASIETQNEVINRIVAKGREDDLTDRQIAMVLAIAKIESGFNPDAAAGTTSARGIGQFVNKTGKAYGITKDNQWDLDTQIDALIAHTRDNYKLAEGKDEAYVYAYHHDGPSLKYGGLKISKNKVMPLVDKFEKYLKRKGELQDIDFPETDNNRTTSLRPRLRDDE